MKLESRVKKPLGYHPPALQDQFCFRAHKNRANAQSPGRCWQSYVACAISSAQATHKIAIGFRMWRCHIYDALKALMLNEKIDGPYEVDVVNP
jgi:hypothetical protein